MMRRLRVRRVARCTCGREKWLYVVTAAAGIHEMQLVLS